MWLSGKESAYSAWDTKDVGWIPGLGRSPGGGNDNHSSFLAWEIPGTEEPGGLQSWHCKELDLTDWAHMHRDTNRQVFLQSSFPGGQGFVGCVEQLDFFLCPVLLPPHSLIPSKHLTLYLSLFKVCFWRTSPVAASLSIWSSCLSFPHLLKQWSENLWFYSSCLAAVISHSLWPHGL